MSAKLLLTVLVGAAVAGLAQAETSPGPILARAMETRKPEQTDPERVGYDRVRREVGLDNLMADYEAFVKPDADDQPIEKKYADHFLGLDFGRLVGNGGWDLWDFVRPTVIAPDGTTHPIMGVERQRGLNVLAEGQEAVVDFLWELPRDSGGKSPGLLGVRFLKRAGDPEWVYLELWLAGAPGWSLGPATFSCYPCNTSKTMDAARERWVSTLTRELPSQNAPTALDPSSEWAFMLHNHLSQEDGGCLMVLDPETLEKLTVAGTYNITPTPTPRAGTRSLRVACGYWAERHWRDELPRFRQEAPQVRERLRQAQFSLSASRIWDSTVAREDYEYLLGLAWLPEGLRDEARQAWTELQRARGPGDQPLPHEGELAFLETAQRCQTLHRRLQEAWLEDLARLPDGGP
jgi:hypothetical protein